MIFDAEHRSGSARQSRFAIDPQIAMAKRPPKPAPDARDFRPAINSRSVASEMNNGRLRSSMQTSGMGQLGSRPRQADPDSSADQSSPELGAWHHAHPTRLDGLRMPRQLYSWVPTPAPSAQIPRAEGVPAKRSFPADPVKGNVRAHHITDTVRNAVAVAERKPCRSPCRPHGSMTPGLRAVSWQSIRDIMGPKGWS